MRLLLVFGISIIPLGHTLLLDGKVLLAYLILLKVRDGFPLLKKKSQVLS